MTQVGDGMKIGASSNGFETDPDTAVAAIYRLTKRFGLWALLAMALVYLVFFEMRGDLRAMRAEHSELLKTLGAMCLNGAESPLEVARCQAAGRTEVIP